MTKLKDIILEEVYAGERLKKAGIKFYKRVSKKGKKNAKKTK